MAKKSMIEKNEMRRRLAKKYAGKRQRLRAIVKNKKLPIEERFAAVLKLAQVPRNSAKERIRNRCEMTGRPRGYYGKLRLSRIALRELGSSGQIPGLVKSSW
ncbi:MAG TPA: 30S ribosomal protein S14 [Xanthobacteraceae bacterium]|jgi:small subunit ribosomal protein S14|nr:30S ribosomal protein S14 [Xanthobacteraceae bacterium]